MPLKDKLINKLFCHKKQLTCINLRIFTILLLLFIKKSGTEGMATFNIRHTTLYRYNGDVVDNRNTIKLYPRPHNHQQVISHNLYITANPIVTTNQDAFGNTFGVFTILIYHRELSISSDLLVSTFPHNIAEEVSKTSRSWTELDVLAADNNFAVFLNPKNYIAHSGINALVNSFNVRSKDPFDVIRELNHYVFANFSYIPNITTVTTTLNEVWNLKAGICQDFSHLLIAMLRLANIPARYISGYICPNKNGMRGDGASHAWVEAFLPNYGWLGIDPTNDCFAEDKHVRLAIGRDYNDICPVKGSFTGNSSQPNMSVSVSVSHDATEPTQVQSQG